MKVKYIFTLLTILSIISFPRNAEAEKGKLSVGLDIGVGWHDFGAKEAAQRVGASVTYDKATFVGRLFADYGVSEDFLLDLGLFKSGNLDATYTIAGASATEAYSAFGVDAAVVYSPSKMPFFIKGGAHISKIFGDASITIGGTSYAASATATGVGWLAGAGFQGKTGASKNWRAGFTYYGNLGGESGADVGFLFAGYKF
jgi:hypothetical protein